MCDVRNRDVTDEVKLIANHPVNFIEIKAFEVRKITCSINNTCQMHYMNYLFLVEALDKSLDNSNVLV